MSILDPTLSTAANSDRVGLEYRLRAVTLRLVALDAALGKRELTGERERQLDAERSTLRGIGREIATVLGPKPSKKPKRLTHPQRQRQLDLLRAELRSRSAGTLHFVARLEREGDYRQARLHRTAMIYVGEAICREYSIPLDLLAHCDPPVEKPIEVDAEPSPLPSAWNMPT